ncbi:hypothetical protein BJ684DRAFT_15209 [Piptocephalis cylindrospora]|uniref:Uncharacterized protein n=1 Tax=Piptocephalis cylindrospora TaxID=1907219 RepID=A0A4P9Y670_9FUNG|nr:hypothetical protein BJ684DRAFT_15209 [Piptocephalis cylindrospora]|eukprot:RKP14475.1 hypothetical protein BJ684DRAFT_15209 [Piptocephalis cylindrospora]
MDESIMTNKCLEGKDELELVCREGTSGRGRKEGEGRSMPPSYMQGLAWEPRQKSYPHTGSGVGTLLGAISPLFLSTDISSIKVSHHKRQGRKWALDHWSKRSGKSPLSKQFDTIDPPHTWLSDSVWIIWLLTDGLVSSKVMRRGRAEGDLSVVSYGAVRINGVKKAKVTGKAGSSKNRLENTERDE